jgi:hypothetical protein
VTERFSFVASSLSLRLNSEDTRRFNVSDFVISAFLDVKECYSSLHEDVNMRADSIVM